MNPGASSGHKFRGRDRRESDHILIEKMKPNKYKEIFGVEKYAFDRLLRLLEVADTYQRKSNAGRKSQLSVLDKRYKRQPHGPRMTIICGLHNMGSRIV